MKRFGECFASRKEKRRWGVVVFVREGLTYRTRLDLGEFDEGKFEAVFVEIVRGTQLGWCLGPQRLVHGSLVGLWPRF
jgi:hypothetical protein